MKTRIIGSILILVVVGALFVVTEQDSTPGTPNINQPTSNDAALKTLSL